MSDPQPIYAFTQFSGGTGAVWRGMNTPLPDGVLAIENDTGIVKRGDGVTRYADLPVFFNALYLQDLAVSVQAAQAAAAAATLAMQQAVALAQQAQLGSQVTVTTNDATPTNFAGMGVLPSGVSNQRIVGQITAQNALTGDVAAWDISALAVRRQLGVTAAFPLIPEITSYYADETMLGCQLQLSTSNLGMVLTATGLAGATIAWEGKVIFSGTAPAAS